MATYDDDEFEEIPRKKKKTSSNKSGKSPQKKSRPYSSGNTSGAAVIWIIVGGLVAVGLLGFLLLPVISKYRLESRRPMAADRMKQLGLALHNYHDTFNRFPPGSVAREDGTQMIGWEAHLLPHLRQRAKFNQIDMNFPWNSPQNEGVFSQQVVAYQNPALQGSTEPNTSHIAGNSHIFFVNRCHPIRDTTDGTANTLAIGEVSAGFKRWGDPTNMRDPALGLGQTAEQFGGPFQGGTHFLILDGSVRFLKSDIDPKILKALATPSGNESLNF